MSLNIQRQGSPAARPSQWPTMRGTYIQPTSVQRAGSEAHLAIPSVVDGKRVARTAPLMLSSAARDVPKCHR